ncbi:ferric reductase-like transmembrane domain-containing protein [Arhodomonas sp. KWT2]|uniref:ferredoxin reductase family protein n=3 Tax=unclassified Arhodomonas TaxID=2621637 RepID=UPI0035BFE64C
MRAIKLTLWSFLAGLTLLWLLADTLLPEPLNYFSFRHAFVQYTGVLAIGTMSLAMVLATRPARAERRLNGLDKMYRLHRWLGIAALTVAVVHWWWALGTKWMVGWGWLSRPGRGPGPAHGGGAGGESLGHMLRGIAETVGEWTFYAVAALIVVALLQRVPYRVFRWTHKWLAVGYLALVFHAIVLTSTDYWAQPVGWVLALLLAAGSIAAALSLSGRIGRSRRVSGTVCSVTRFDPLRVVAATVALAPDWPGHVPGQFAFVTVDRNEGAHPYTIASAWDPKERCVEFVVKGLGDHTAQLQQQLCEGTAVTVEGPYGCFDFDDARPRQIWVGAGIGITPFIARMQYLARHPGGAPVDLFHPTTDHDPAAIERLTRDARAAGVRLHVTITPRDGRLTPDDIRRTVPEWREAGLWFCGPVAFGRALRRDFTAHGLPADAFHQELFRMR